ncbi:MAG: hypothetical protein QM770_14495 [Tepidisphaeraceae bacterium]
MRQVTGHDLVYLKSETTGSTQTEGGSESDTFGETATEGRSADESAAAAFQWQRRADELGGSQDDLLLPDEGRIGVTGSIARRTATASSNAKTRTHGASTTWQCGRSHTVTLSPHIVPRYEEVPQTPVFWSLQEQVFRITQAICTQPQRTCLVRLAGGSKAVLLRTPDVRPALATDAMVRAWQATRLLLPVAPPPSDTPVDSDEPDGSRRPIDRSDR